MTSKEWAEKTVRDITRKRVLRAEGQKQATAHCVENVYKVKRRLKWTNIKVIYQKMLNI